MPLVFGRSILGFAVVADDGVTWTDPDIANASYDSVSFSVSTQDTVPRTATFKDDGTKMYMLGQNSDEIHQYSLSTAWDLSTASYDSVTFDVSTQTGFAAEFWWSTDGDYFYVVDIIGSAVIFQYNLTTAWDLSTASYANKSFDPSEEATPIIIGFKSDGTKVYIGGNVNDTLYQYSLSTAWDISTASYDSKSLDYSSQLGNSQGLFISPNGDKVWIVGAYNENTVYEYGLTTPWDMSTGSYSSISKTLSQDNNIQSLFFKSDGSKLYAMGGQNDTIYQYSTAAVAWTTPDIANASYDSVSLSVSSEENFGHDIFFKPDGTKLYMVGTQGDDVNEYSLSTAWDLSTASYSQNFSVSTEEAGPSGIFFKDDGTKMYITGQFGQDVNEYNLSTAWDISTASYSQLFSVSAQVSIPRAIFFKGDGTKMFIADQTGSDVNEYSLSTGWDVSTASYTQNFSTSSQSTSPQAVYFNPDGTEMFVADAASDIYKYSLSTGWDLSTASYDSITFDASSQNTSLLGLSFKTDGSKMYTLDNQTDAIYQYST
jgi:6-phosphogluconolactonase (cycloisomerase 2 family)